MDGTDTVSRPSCPTKHKLGEGIQGDASEDGGAYAPGQGKQLSDYEDLPSEYRIEELPNASYKVAIHIATGKTVGVFDSSIFPTTQAQVLNILASYGATLAALFVSGPAAALGVEVFKALLGEALSDVHRMLSEHTQGFNGDFAPFRPPLPTGADPFPLTDPGTAGNDTRWGTGGLIGALYADTLYGQGKRLANTC